MNRAIVLLGLWCGACGFEESAPPMEFAVQRQFLGCDRPILAKLIVSGVPGECPIDVGDDGLARGTCFPIPTGEVRDFELRYFATLPEDRVYPSPPFDPAQNIPLGRVSARVDLREETDSTLTLEFRDEQLNTEFDEDGDGARNIEEHCDLTRDPLRPDA